MRRPLSLTIVGWLFILVGAATLSKDWVPLLSMNADERAAWMAIEGVPITLLIWGIRLAGAVGGALVLAGVGWSRWLLAVWMIFHVAISLQHSVSEMLMHAVIFGAVAVFLFGRNSTAYFRRARG